jgi:hypothetical protein
VKPIRTLMNIELSDRIAIHRSGIDTSTSNLCRVIALHARFTELKMIET